MYACEISVKIVTKKFYGAHCNLFVGIAHIIAKKTVLVHPDGCHYSPAP